MGPSFLFLSKTSGGGEGGKLYVDVQTYFNIKWIFFLQISE